MVNKKIKKTVADWEKWKNIHSDFSEETVGLWKDKNFTYEQAEKWVKAFRKDFSPSNIDYFEWIKNIRRPTPFQLINRRNLEKLPEEFKEYQKGLKTTKVFSEEEESSGEIIFERESEQEDLTPLDLKEQLEIEKSKTQKIGRQRKISLIENEKISGQLAEKEEEITSLKLELSKSRNSQKKLEKQLAEKEKLLKDSEEKLEDLTNQSKEEKLKLVASQSTRIKEGIDKKKIIEEKLANFETELSRTRGNYETQIVKLRAEKSAIEKQNAANLQLLNAAQSKIKELTKYQEENKKSTKQHFRNQSSSSSNSPITTDIESDASSSPKNTRSFRNTLRQKAKRAFPTINSPKNKKSLAQELDTTAFKNDAYESGTETSEASPFSEDFPSPRDDSFTSYATTPDVSDTESSVKLETKKTIKAVPSKEKNNNDGSMANYYKSIAQKYEQVEQELGIARGKIQDLEQENNRQLNVLKEKDEEIQKLRSSKENEKPKRSFSFPNLKTLNNSKSSRLKDELAITKAEKGILEQEVLKKEFKEEELEKREIERNKKFNKIKNEFEEAAREVKFYSDDLKFLEQKLEVGQVINAGNFSQIKRISKSRSTPVTSKDQKNTSPNFTWEFLTQDPYSDERLISEKGQNSGNKKVNRLKEKDRSILELEKKTNDDKQQEESDWETASSFGSPTDSIFSHRSRDGSESSFSSSSSINSRNSLAPISFLKARINRLESEASLLKKETNKNELEIKEKSEEIGKLKTSLLQYLKKQVIFVSKLEEQKDQLKLLIVDSNEEEQVKIKALLNEIDNSLKKVKSDWESVRESIGPEEIFPKDWEEASSVFFDFDGIGLIEDDENLSDSETDSELKELAEKFNNLLNLGKSILEDKRIASQSPIKEDFELEERERKFDEETWKVQEKILREQAEKNDDLDQLCKSAEEHEQKEFIQGQEYERQRSKIAWEILDLYIQLEEELKDLDEKKQVSEEKIKTLEEVVFLLKIVGRKIGLEDEETEEKIFQIAKETVQDQELLSQLLTVYNNFFSRGKTYNREKEIIKKIINDLGLELEQDSSLNEVIEFIKELISPPNAIAKNKENEVNSEEIKGECDEQKSASEDDEEEQMTAEKIEEMVDEFRQLREKISKVEYKNNEGKKEKNELLKELDDLKEKYNDLLSSNIGYEKKITKLEKEIEERQKYQTKAQEFETKIEIVKQFLPKER